jgi:hypothetical protein
MPGCALEGFPQTSMALCALRQNPLIRAEVIVLTSCNRMESVNVHPEPLRLVGPEVCLVSGHRPQEPWARPLRWEPHG